MQDQHFSRPLYAAFGRAPAGKRPLLLAFTLVLVLLLVALTPVAARPAEEAITRDGSLLAEVVPIVTGLDDPVGIYNAADGSGRLFFLERDGRIRIWDGISLLPTPFLDIDSLITSSGSEQGLLGLAFHPNYESNGYFYVNYTDSSGGDTVIARYSVTADPNIADPGSAVKLTEIDQPFSNHNGGQVKFGPDGYLYIGMGDGGSGGDPGDRAQDLTELLGKMLRIDVDAASGDGPDCGSGFGTNYRIPADNPFADGPGGNCDEIWAYGLRNPWRFTFDRLTGDMYIGDVGQDSWEEVDLQPAGSSGGENYGWRCYEGNHAYNLTGCDDPSAYVFPIAEYSHAMSGVCSVTGGYAYRGTALPQYVGAYWFADYCSGQIWVTKFSGGQWRVRQIANTSYIITTFGEMEDGELCFTDYSPGTVYCILP